MNARELIRQYRTERNLTLADLGRRVGTDHSYMSRIENGDRGLSQSMVECLVEAMELPVEDANELRKAAGFPTEGMYVTIPTLVQLNAYLTDPDLPPDIVLPIRRQLSSMVGMLAAIVMHYEDDAHEANAEAGANYLPVL